MATSKGPLRRYGVVFASAVALASPASAALFGDSELTRQTQALQQRVEALDARLGKLETAMQQNSKLLDMLQEVERLKAEVARLRGQAEVQVHQLDTLGKRQSDLYADLDQRIGDLAKAAATPSAGAGGGGPALPGATATAESPTAVDAVAESRVYEAALRQFREAKYEDAIAGFKGFLKAYPGSTLAANAQYWIGYAYYALKDYKSALAHQQKLVAAYPASPKVPDALLNIATSQIALDDLAGARKTLEEIVAKHSGSNAAALAERRLAVLK